VFPALRYSASPRLPTLSVMQTIAYAAHVAHLDPVTGEGLLVRPPAADDLVDRLGHGSLHEADWNAAVRHLDDLGWEPSEDEVGGLCHVGHTRDGRAVVGLYGRAPVITAPSLAQAADAYVDLRRLAGLTE
jgi:hypothetical protein